ncbi:MAG TPA: hypothetical protein P5121_20890 [Caldilineaceae bacterium]|nr:hypothetical protein [Caldilineaceae bacterium]
MKRNLVSAGFGLVLTLALVFPGPYSLVNVGGVSTASVNVNDSCVRVKVDGEKITVCDNGGSGGVDKLDVSWNSGGG